MNKYDELDNLSPDGIYAVPDSPNEPKLRVREMYSYCKEHGKRPEDLTPKERKKFLLYDKE